MRSVNKYRNKRTEVDGIKFQSAGEAKRWRELKLLEENGKIKNLRRQVPFRWKVTYTVGENKFEETQRYVADFVYVERGQEVIEDFKGYRTIAYLKKKKLMKLLYGIEIRETK